MRNKAINASKKKSFFKTFISENIGIVLLAVFIFYMIICGFISKYIFNYKFEEGMIASIPALPIGLILLSALYFLIRVVIIDGIYYFVNKCKAINKYIYLPLTEDEVRNYIKSFKFENNANSYIEYLTEQMEYNSVFYFGSLYFKDDEIKQIVKTCKAVFNSPVYLRNYSVTPFAKCWSIKDYKECHYKQDDCITEVFLMVNNDYENYNMYKNKGDCIAIC